VDIHAAIEQFNAKLQDLKQVNNDLVNEREGLSTQLQDLENRLEVKNEHIQDLQKEKYALSGEIATLEELL
jgi:chromosome segregation ATPase